MSLDLLFVVVAATFALIFGFFLIRFPLSAFEVQRRFYRMINWDIKPVSVEKEIRNTKLMGAFLIAVTVGICLLKWLRI